MECSLLLSRGLSLRVNRESGVLVSQVGVAGGRLLLLGGLLSDALDLLELVFAHLRGFLKLVDDVALELFTWGLADSGLLLGDGLDTGKMLAKLKLALLSGLLALLISGELLVLGLFQKLLVLVVNGSLALESKAAAFLSNARRNRTNAVAKDIGALLSGSIELFLNVALCGRGWLRICLKALLDLRVLIWRWVATLSSGRARSNIQNREGDGMWGVLFLLEDLGDGGSWWLHLDVLVSGLTDFVRVRNFLL